MDNNTETTTKTASDGEAKPGIAIYRWLLRVLQGAMIGVGAILPGISGGMLCLVFGIYHPMMELLAHPVRAFKTHIKLLFPVLIGVIIGFVGLAGLVEWMFRASFNLAVYLFVGLIAGMMPSLFREAGKEGRTKAAWTAFAVSMAIMLAFLIYIKNGTAMNIQPNIWWFFLCGVLWGLSLVVPGMSSSSFIIFLGLYQQMAEGIKSFDFSVLLPLGAGLVLVVFLSARIIKGFFEKHYAVAIHTILGIVIASTLVIIPLEFKDVMEAVWGVVCFAVGFVAAWFMDRAMQKVLYNRQE